MKTHKTRFNAKGPHPLNKILMKASLDKPLGTLQEMVKEPKTHK